MAVPPILKFLDMLFILRSLSLILFLTALHSNGRKSRAESLRPREKYLISYSWMLFLPPRQRMSACPDRLKFRPKTSRLE